MRWFVNCGRVSHDAWMLGALRESFLVSFCIKPATSRRPCTPTQDEEEAKAAAQKQRKKSHPDQANKHQEPEFVRVAVLCCAVPCSDDHLPPCLFFVRVSQVWYVGEPEHARGGEPHFARRAGVRSETEERTSQTGAPAILRTCTPNREIQWITFIPLLLLFHCCWKQPPRVPHRRQHLDSQSAASARALPSAPSEFSCACLLAFPAAPPPTSPAPRHSQPAGPASACA